MNTFAADAEHALIAGFDVAGIYAAHGYLVHQFLSPHTNERDGEYGGSFENRTRLAREVTAAVREEWPDDKPLLVRLSATDWIEGGRTVDESVELVDQLAELGVDLVDVSAGALDPAADPPERGPSYLVPIAETITEATGVPARSVGNITSP